MPPYTLIILICLAATPPYACNLSTATDAITLDQPMPELAQCLLAGKLYADHSDLVIPGKTYPKLYCQPAEPAP